MFNDLIRNFEKDKNSKCCICGSKTTHNCIELIGSLTCDMPLCDTMVCDYVHNVIKHPQKYALLKKYESKINSNVRLKALNKKLRQLRNSLNNYKSNLEKNKNIEPVSKMFSDLIVGKNQEIDRVKNKIDEINKENGVLKHL